MPRYEEITDRNLSAGIDEVFDYVNSVTNSTISNMILIAIYIITVMSIFSFRRNEEGAFFDSMAIAGFLTFVVGLFFWIAGFISGITFSIVVAVAIMSFASLWLKGN